MSCNYCIVAPMNKGKQWKLHFSITSSFVTVPECLELIELIS